MATAITLVVHQSCFEGLQNPEKIDLWGFDRFTTYQNLRGRMLVAMNTRAKRNSNDRNFTEACSMTVATSDGAKASQEAPQKSVFERSSLS